VPVDVGCGVVFRTPEIIENLKENQGEPHFYAGILRQNQDQVS